MLKSETSNDIGPTDGIGAGGDENDYAGTDHLGETLIAAKAENQALVEEAKNLHQFRTMVEDMPINVMTCELENFTIDYANAATLVAIKGLEGALNIKATELVGTCIDKFHKNPTHQRQILADPKNLPHQAQIEIGGEILDLLITAIRDGQGQYVSAMLTWSVVTEQVASDKRISNLMSMLDNMPINVMTCDKDTLELNYVNETSKNTLRPLQSLLPVPVDKLEGTCIDVFHKNPSHQRKILSDPANLPFRSKINLGEHILDLQVSAIMDAQGNYIGPMVCWSVVTEQVKMIENFENNVKVVIDQVAAASTEMEASSGSMKDSATEGAEQAATAAAASQESNANMETIASATEEMTSSVDEISSRVAESAKIATAAVEEAGVASQKINELAEAAETIGSIINLITDIASQTNLLALNATIEAARAGDAGKGFAVVASEVKSLANQTANATDDISKQIAAIQEASTEGVTAIEGITSTIETINEIASGIASAVEEQGMATREISRNVQEATIANAEVVKNVDSVNVIVTETGNVASQVMEAAAELSTQAEKLGQESDTFLEHIKSL